MLQLPVDPDALDLRWQTARLLHQATAAPEASADTVVQAAVLHLDGQARAGDCLATAVADAVHLHADPKRRALVEAWTLCRDLSRDEVGRTLAIAEPVLETYEKLFFDVRPHHDRPAALLLRLGLACDFEASPGHCTPEGLQWLALQGGSSLLQAALCPQEAHPDALNELRRLTGHCITISAALAAWRGVSSPTELRRLHRLLATGTPPPDTCPSMSRESRLAARLMRRQQGSVRLSAGPLAA